MINAKLDSKFSAFLQESKEKISDIGREIENLSSENSLLEQQVNSIFHANSDVSLEVKKLEEQLKRFKDLHSLNVNDQKVLKQKADKAKKDYECLTALLKNQTESSQIEKKSLVEKEKELRIMRKSNEESFKDKLISLENRIEELQREKQLKSETNDALISELSHSENIEADILNSIKAELLNLNSLTSQSFYKSR